MRTPSALLLRVIALLLHALANYVVVSYLTDYDISGSWATAVGFVALLAVLFYLFVLHILSFLRHLKHNP